MRKDLHFFGWAQMLLVDNMVHSDLHPGNILVRLDPPRGSRTLARFLTDKLGLEVRRGVYSTVFLSTP